MILTIARHIQEIRKKIGDTVALVVVIKHISSQDVQKALSAGTLIVGENRLQEAEKHAHLLEHVEKHFIGHVQTNKVKKIVALFDCIQTVDSLKLARLINTESKKQGKIMSVMIQVNIGEEEQKHGVFVEQLKEFYDHLLDLKYLDVVGLMCIPPVLDISEKGQKGKLRSYFQHMKLLQKDFKLKHCSMGMTNDYMLAVEEGSTMVRIGRGIFGERS